MKCTVLDQNGKAIIPHMGCYGIGVERTMAAVMEQSHDKYGPVWPLAIAPYQLHIIALNPKKEGVSEVSEQLYNHFKQEGLEVLFDDRGEKAGFCFNDADLIGVPFRIIVSPKTLAENKIEFKSRDKSFQELIDLDKAAELITSRVKEELKSLLSK